MLCGIISGFGGMLSTYAFAQENEGYSGALCLGTKFLSEGRKVFWTKGRQQKHKGANEFSSP